MDNGPRRWLITGVSTGLGRSLLEAAVERGDRVVGTLRSMAQAAEIEQKAPGRIRIVRMDVTDPASVESAMAESIGWLGGLDVLVNNAGSGVFGPVETCGVEDFEQAMAVNYFGLIRVTRAALPHLRASKGTLVNIASMAGFLAMGGTSPYTAAKHAVLGVTEALAEELAPFGVRVICSLPGGFRTNFWSPQSNTIRQGLADVYGPYPCGQIAERSRDHVGHEMGDPAKFARAMVDLVHAEHPPLYFVAGADAMEYVGYKLEQMTAELEKHKATSLGMGFD